MSLTTRELLGQLIELTPMPPNEAEIDPLLAAFEAILARRAEVFERLVPPLTVTDAERPLVRELESRDAAWQDALTRALQCVREQRHGNEQLRAYAVVV